jgi:SAM-dependent methyltransferase
MNKTRPCPNCECTSVSVKFVVPPFHIVKCRRCSLVFLADPPDDEMLYERYHESPEQDPHEYRARTGNPELAELFAINNMRLRFIRSVRPVGHLPDLGCGRGFFLYTALSNGYDVSGVDISGKAIAYAREKFGLSAEVRTLEEVAAGSVRFDIVTLWHVLEHFPDPLKALSLVRALLARNGVCVVEVPNLRSLKFMLASQKWQGGNHPLYHRTFFTSATLRRALFKSGFSDVCRVNLSYRIPGRSRLDEAGKSVLARFAMDSFLDFVAYR